MAAKKLSKSAKLASAPLPGFQFVGEDLNTLELKLGQGAKRPYIITVPSEQLQLARSNRSPMERVLIAVLLVVSLVMRLYKLSQPNSVVFDEVHFGGFARKYILGTYFLDVHPPLAKMLYAGVGYVFGYNGSFEFAKIGDEFTELVPYVMMRAFSALCGVGTIFALYSTLRLSGCKPLIAFVTSSLLLIENANFTISRYILLDSPLIFFIACTAYSLKRSQMDTPFTYNWYKSLIATGVSLGLALSSKWVGLFTVAWVGLITVWDLWFVLGDISVKPLNLIKQIIAKLTFFLGIPIVLYLYFFNVHYQLLNKEGDGAAFMSAPFRSTLIGNTLPRNIPAEVGVGSIVSIRHLNTQGGYLHSHNHLYETGSKQQQITLYPHLDDNNLFQIELYNETSLPNEFVPITDGTKIRLVHLTTKRRLHSHDIKAPVSENADWQKEASCYGFDGFEGDPNDDFIVEIVKQQSKKGEAQNHVRALQTVFKLRHAMTGCCLFSHEVKLPDWGFEQQEVTCATQGIEPLEYWYIETNQNQFLPLDLETLNYELPSFWSKFVESHQKMWKVNKGLTEPHNWESSPDSWPLLLRGINYWVKGAQIYLIGNYVTWYSVTLSIAAFVIYVAVQFLRWQRGYPVLQSLEVFNFNVQALHFILGWALHYFPSFLMGRQLFLHHYLPLFYFGILALGQFLEIAHSYLLKNKKYVSYAILAAFFSAAVSVFIQYSPLIKGDQWTRGKCQSLKLLDTWDFDCNAFGDSPPAYGSMSQEPPNIVQTPSIDFQAAVPVKQNEDFGQEVIAESDNVEIESQVEVETTPEEIAPPIIAKDESTVGEPVLQLETDRSEKPGPKLEQREKMYMIKNGVYVDEDGNELPATEQERAQKIKDLFPIDKMTVKQLRRNGDAIGTVIE